MKVVRYLAQGRQRLGVRGTDGIHPADAGDLRELLEAEEDPITALKRCLERPVEQPDGMLAPLAQRCQIISTGGNYRDHLAEVGLSPAEPVFFPKLWSSVLDPGKALHPPLPETDLDYEVELAIVIGRKAHAVREDEAMDHVFGFTVVNDVSAREVMRREPLQIMLCKSADGFLPVSEEIVTADEIDLTAMTIGCEVNGELRQRAHVSEMIHPIPRLISFLSQYVTLTPGDLITTGTPGGSAVGRPGTPYLAPGDVLTTTATGISPIRTPIGATAC